MLVLSSGWGFLVSVFMATSLGDIVPGEDGPTAIYVTLKVSLIDRMKKFLGAFVSEDIFLGND